MQKYLRRRYGGTTREAAPGAGCQGRGLWQRTPPGKLRPLTNAARHADERYHHNERRKPCPGKRRGRLAATRCVSQVVKEAAASRLGSRRKTARIRMRMATTQRANRELHNRANRCRCHEPARGHFWDPVTLRCTNGSCTRTWGGQQVSPTNCEHRRSAPWERTPDAFPTGSVRDAGLRRRRHMRGEV